MDAIKNIEYDLSRYAKAIEKMDDKLIIQEKPATTTEYDTTRVQLAKISINNYISHLAESTILDKTSSIGTSSTSQVSQQTENQKRLN